MNITELLAKHVSTADSEHRLTLASTRQLRCHSCHHTIDLPIFAAQAPTPPPFVAPTEPPASPEVIADCRRIAAEALALVRQRRTEA